ncbi:MAG: efflux RND transporter permease subunit [Leptospirales bacterium]|nr:efflux RND transporter permease subunit [Leptospirales bacterium]
MRKLIDLSLNYPWKTLAAGMLVAILGAAALLRLPVDAVPDITNVQVMVNTRTGALAPEEIEKTVTRPVEAEMTGLPGVEEVRSISKYGLSQVVVIFHEGTDLYFSRQQIAERLGTLRDELPEGLSPEMGPVSTGLGEVVMYSVEAKPGSRLSMAPEHDQLLRLRTVQDRIIRPALKAVSGVADVDSNGGFLKQVHVNMNPYRMAANNVSVGALKEYLENIGINQGGNYIEKSGERTLVRGLGRFDTLDSLSLLPLSFGVLSNDVQLRDLAQVQFGGSPRIGAATSNGRETVLGTVFMRVGENSRVVSERAVLALQSIALPDDVAVNIVYSRKFLVDTTIQTVETNLAEGAMLVIVVMFLLIGNFRAALIACLAIPLSMLVAASGMVASGVSANLMSLGALDFGLLVDGSLVIVENCVRHYEQNPPTGLSFAERLKRVREAASEVAGPVVSGMLVIIIVYVPILGLSGVEGKMFRPMAVTVLFALVGSLLTCLTIVPVLTAIFLRAPKHAKPGRLISFLSRIYSRVLAFSLSQRLILTVGSVLLVAVSSVLFLRLGSDFVPQLDEGDLAIGIVRGGNISLEESVRQQKETEKVIMRFPEVKRVFARMGTPESATDPMGVNFADTFLILEKDRGKWRKGPDGKNVSKDQLYESIVKEIEAVVPGQEYGPTQPIEMRFNEMLEGSRADVAIRVYGDDLTALLETIEKIESVVKEIDGVGEAEMDELTAIRQGPVLDAVLDPVRLARRAVHPGEAMDAFITGMAGREVGAYYEKDLVYPIILRLGDEYRKDLRAISALPIDLPGDSVASLGSVFAFKQSLQGTNIARYNGRRYASVAVFLAGRDVESFVTEAQRKLKENVVLPAGYEIQYAGQYENLKKARIRLFIIVPILLLAIAGILYQTFGSLRHTLLILTCIPMALSGGMLALFVRNTSFSIPAGIGFIALSGIAVLNGTVLVSVFNQLRSAGLSVAESVRQGCAQRFRPVLTTALVASLGFIPMAINSGLGAEVQRPLATVVIGGLITATLLTLVLLPALYSWAEGRAEKKVKG